MNVPPWVSDPVTRRSLDEPLDMNRDVMSEAFALAGHRGPVFGWRSHPFNKTTGLRGITHGRSAPATCSSFHPGATMLRGPHRAGHPRCSCGWRFCGTPESLAAYTRHMRWTDDPGDFAVRAAIAISTIGSTSVADNSRWTGIYSGRFMDDYRSRVLDAFGVVPYSPPEPAEDQYVVPGQNLMPGGAPLIEEAYPPHTLRTYRFAIVPRSPIFLPAPYNDDGLGGYDVSRISSARELSRRYPGRVFSLPGLGFSRLPEYSGKSVDELRDLLRVVPTRHPRWR